MKSEKELSIQEMVIKLKELHLLLAHDHPRTSKVVARLLEECGISWKGYTRRELAQEVLNRLKRYAKKTQRFCWNCGNYLGEGYHGDPNTCETCLLEENNRRY